MRRRQFFSALSACVLALGAQFSHAESAAAPTFVIGVAPHTSARVILEMFQPLRRQLEASLGQPVAIQTAPDFTEFARRALHQDYDLAITTGHQARLYQTDAGYLPLLTYKADFVAVALVDRNGPIKRPEDLRGKLVLGLSPTSLVTLWGEHWLRQQKLGSTVRYVSAADSVSRQVLAGEAAAAFVSEANYQKLPDDLRSQLVILAQSDPLAGRVYMLNKRHASRLEQVDAALWKFAASDAGQAYFAQNKLGGYRKLRSGELEAMDPYAAETRRVVNGK